MAKLSDKLDQIISDINEIKVLQAEHTVLHRRNTDDLERHIKRTDLAEKRIEMLTQQDAQLKIDLLKEIEPIKRHVGVVEATIKVILLTLSMIGATILGLHQLGVFDKLF